MKRVSITGWILLVALVASACLNLMLCRRLDRCCAERVPLVLTDTVYIDTVVYRQPKPTTLTIVRRDTVFLPVAGDTAEAISDTVAVAVDVEQRVYADAAYTAWVSGYRPALDSIRIYARTEIVTNTVFVPAKTKRWHLGVSAGYGLSAQGVQPYIGIGLTYSFLSF